MHAVPAAPVDAATRKLNRAKTALWKSLLSMQPDFQKDLHNLEAMNACAHWLIREPFGDMTKGKGFNLSGPVGTGKTLLMQATSRAMVLGGAREGFPVVNALRIVKEFNRTDDGSRDRSRLGGDHVILHYANLPILGIDDIAMEGDGKHYGREANVIGEILMLRYERFRRGEAITHTSTNGDPEVLHANYDSRVITRWVEMCGEFQMGGDNRRPYAAAPATMHVMPDLFSEPPVRHMPSDEEARAHFARIREAMNEALAEVNKLRPARAVIALQTHSQAEHLTGFMAGLEAYDDEQLRALHERLSNGNKREHAAPYLRAVDNALASRSASAPVLHTATDEAPTQPAN